MARNIDTIMTDMLVKKSELASLDGLTVLTESEKNSIENLNSTSKVSIWRMLFYIVAASIWALENIFDIFRLEVDATIAENQIGTPDWYKKKMLEFQYGFDFNRETGKFDDAGASTAEIAASKIVKQAAVEEIGGRLKLKAARELDGNLAPLNNAQYIAFKLYCEKFKYAGTRLIIVSRIPDDIIGDFTIYYDPLILDAYGARLDGTNNAPVQAAFRNYLRNLSFNGEFSITRLTDALQVVSGVKEPKVNTVQTKYGLFPYSAVSEYYIADAGYMELDLDASTFEFMPREI